MPFPHSKTTLNIAISLALLTALTACTSVTQETKGKVRDIEGKVNETLLQSHSTEKFSYFNEVNELNLGTFNWGDGRIDRPEQLDTKLTYSNKKEMPVIVALNRISDDTGIHINLDDKALTYLKVVSAEEEGSTSSNSFQFQSTIPPILGGTEDELSSVESIDSERSASAASGLSVLTNLSNEERGNVVVLDVRDKTLEEWLDDFTLSRSLFWDYNYVNNEPYITISASIDSAFMYEGITNVTADGAVSSGAAESWGEIIEYTNSNLTAIGSANFSATTGRIQVNDRPEALNRISTRIDQENKLFNTEILYTLTFVSYSSSQSERFSADISALYSGLRDSITFSSASSSVADGYSLSATSTSSNGDTGTGTLSIIDSISKTAKTKKIAGKSRNRTPFYRSLLGKESIVESISVATDSVTEITTAEPTIAEIETGISVNLIGSVLSGGRIAIDLSISRDEEIGRETVEYTSGNITLPNSREDSILQQFNLNDGESIVISDSDLSSSADETGVNDKLGWINYLFGGSESTSDSSSITLLIIKADIVGGKA